MNKTPRVVVITGGGSGIGLDASVRFGQLGDTIIIIGRTESKLKNVQSKIRNNGGECIYFTGDVADPTFVNQATNEIIKKYKNIDILVNNAGHSSKNRNTENTTLEDVVNVFNSNLLGTVLFTQAVLPSMKKTNKGLVVNVSSVAGLSGSLIAGLSYGAAKAGVINFTEYLNAELKNTMIKATAIMPGEVDTPIMDNRPIVPSDDSRASMAKSADVAETIVFLASLSNTTSIHAMTIMPNKLRDTSAELILPKD